MVRLLVATRNPGKAKEYAQLLRDLPLEVTYLDQVGVAEDVEETGHSFEENARIKARAYAALSGLLTLADDSGLEVDALGGEPGVRSARYAGDGASDEDRVALLLKNMDGVPWAERTARFRCVIAIATLSGEVRTVADVVDGVIQYEPKDKYGFGYDPVFYLPEPGMTMAELPTDQKNRVSHRAKAARKAVNLLKVLAEKGSRIEDAVSDQG